MKKLLPLVLFFVLSCFASIVARAADAAEKYTFVVVHGATAGGWEWKRTGQFLTDDGHTVYRATLTGLGERMHLNSTEVDLQTHINDVVNLILFEDLHDIVLTGHSYGGMVITGVMDRVPERIRHVVFLDAAVPDDGMALWDIFGGNSRDPSRFVDGFMQVPWVKPDAKPPHNVKQSIKCFNQPVSYKNPAALALPVTYVAFGATGAAPGSGGGVFGEQPGDRVGAQRSASTSREHRIGWAAVVFAEPAGERGDGVGGQRRRAFLASLAVAPDVWPGAQLDIAADESGQFGDPQTGLDGQREQGLITATEPGAVVGRGQQGVDLVAGQEAHQFLLVTFGGDGQHPLDRLGVLRMPQGGVAEERVDRGEPGVAGGHAVASLGF